MASDSLWLLTQDRSDNCGFFFYSFILLSLAPCHSPEEHHPGKQKGLTQLQSNVFITDSKGTWISVRIIEVSVLERLALYEFRSLRDEVKCP